MWNYLKNLKGMNWFVYIGMGVLVVLIGLALTIWLLIAFGSRLTPVPLAVTAVQPGFAGEVCPGTEITTVFDAVLKDALVIEYFTSMMDAERKYTIPDYPLGHMFAPYEEGAIFVQPIEWVVPEYEAGTYNFTVTLWMRGVGADPVNIYVEYTIGADCP